MITKWPWLFVIEAARFEISKAKMQNISRLLKKLFLKALRGLSRLFQLAYAKLVAHP